MDKIDGLNCTFEPARKQADLQGHIGNMSASTISP